MRPLFGLAAVGVVVLALVVLGPCLGTGADRVSPTPDDATDAPTTADLTDAVLRLASEIAVARDSGAAEGEATPVDPGLATDHLRFPRIAFFGSWEPDERAFRLGTHLADLALARDPGAPTEDGGFDAARVSVEAMERLVARTDGAESLRDALAAARELVDDDAAPPLAGLIQEVAAVYDRRAVAYGLWVELGRVAAALQASPVVESEAFAQLGAPVAGLDLGSKGERQLETVDAVLGRLEAGSLSSIDARELGRAFETLLGVDGGFNP